MRDPRYYEVHAALLLKLPQLRRRCASAEQLPANAIVVRSAVESERTGMFWHRRAWTYHPALLHASCTRCCSNHLASCAPATRCSPVRSSTLTT
jgi:hypothetical protein